MPQYFIGAQHSDLGDLRQCGCRLLCAPLPSKAPAGDAPPADARRLPVVAERYSGRSTTVPLRPRTHHGSDPGAFCRAGFHRVETPILQHSPGNEAHLHAFATERIGPDGGSDTLYLRTSPEFACKKLLAGGERRIFELAKVFRNRERSARHHPEFTMLEWYRAEAPYETLMDDCADLLALAARAGGTSLFQFAGMICDPFLRRSGSPWRPHSRATPGFPWSRFSAAPARSPRRSRSPAPRRRREFASRRTIPGRTCSRVFWWSGSNPISARAGDDPV